MRLSDAPEIPEAPGQFWKDFIRDTAPVFRSDTQEQLGGFILPTWQALIDGARYVDERLTEIFDELAARRDRGGQRLRFSRHPGQRPPLGPDRVLQPAGGHRPRAPAHVLRACRSRIAPTGRRSGPSTRRQVGDLQASFSEFCVERGAPPLPAMDMIHESPWLNLYLYPQELDYPRGVDAGPHLAQPRTRACAPPTIRGQPPEAPTAAASSTSASARWARPTWSSCGGSWRCWPTRRTATSSAAVRATTSTSWPTT